MQKLLYPSLQEGLVGAWCPSRDNSRSTILTDFSPYKNNGVLTLMDPGTDWVASDGKVALDFDGVNDYVIANSQISTLPITFICWCSQTAAVTYAGTISSNNVALLSNGAGTAVTYIWEGTSDEYDGASGLTITNGKLEFRALVVTSTYAKVWLNGSSWTNTKAHSAKTFTNIYIGTDRNIHPFSGRVFDSAIFGRALTDSEISLIRTIGPGGIYATKRVIASRRATTGSTSASKFIIKSQATSRSYSY